MISIIGLVIACVLMLAATVFILALLKASADGRIEVEEDDGEYLS